MARLIADLIEQIIQEGKNKGLDQKGIARKAGISPETLSRAKRASDLQLSTLVRLAAAVGLRVALVQDRPVLEKILSGDVFGADRP